MIDYDQMRRKFPSKKPTRKSGKAAVLKAIAKEYELKKAELGASAPLIRRGFPYYMTIITALLVVGGLVLTAISKRGVVADDLAAAKAEIPAVFRFSAEVGVHTFEVGFDRRAPLAVEPFGGFFFDFGLFSQRDEGVFVHSVTDAPYFNVLSIA